MLSKPVLLAHLQQQIAYELATARADAMQEAFKTLAAQADRLRVERDAARTNLDACESGYYMAHRRCDDLTETLKIIAGCQADKFGGTTLGSWEMARVKGVLARVAQ